MRRTLLLISVLVLSIAARAQTRTWEQSRFEEFEKGTAKGVAITSDGALELAPMFRQLAVTPSTYIWSMGADNDGNVFAAAGSPARVYRIAPNGQVTVVLEPQELQVQALVVAANGTVFAATSPDGRVYRIDRKPNAPKTKDEMKGAKPQPRTENQPPETNTAPPAQSSAQSAPEPERPRNVAADPNYISSVYFEPKTKYIWSLALDTSGNLFVATGDRGEIYRVDANTRQGTVFFKSDEAHIRTLAFGPKGNLVAGSDGSGLIYRISPTGEGFVLYSAPKKEITALAIDDVTGTIYAAGVGEKRALGGPSTSPASGTSGAPTSTAMSGSGASTMSALSPIAAPPALTPVTGSELYQVAPDGSPRRLWSSREDIVYALAFDTDRRLIAGTGNRGRVFSVRGEDEFADLLKATATQVTAFAKAPNGARYVATSNLGKVFLLGPAPESEGSYVSDVFDARIFSRWGRAEIRGAGSYQLFARSGNVDNPDRNWSPWRQVALDRDLPVEVPPARFIQWKTVLVSGRTPPRIESVLLNYLPKNIAPHIDDVNVQVAYKFPQQPRTVADGTSSSSPPQMPQPARDRDFIAVRWTARDDNDDTLSYAVYYRGDGETRWRLLKDRLLDRFYSFESGLLPDGGYTIRVVASDAPSHTPEEALTDEHESRRFEVDNTAPRVENLAAIDDGNALHVTFRALDTFSPVRRAEFSIDAGDWQLVEPVGQISDARLENYDFNVPLPERTRGVPTEGTPELKQRDRKNRSRDDGRSDRGQANGQSTRDARGGDGALASSAIAPQTSAEHLIVVRVWDRFDNMATAKIIARPAPQQARE